MNRKLRVMEALAYAVGQMVDDWTALRCAEFGLDERAEITAAPLWEALRQWPFALSAPGYLLGPDERLVN